MGSISAGRAQNPREFAFAVDIGPDLAGAIIFPYVFLTQAVSDKCSWNIPEGIIFVGAGSRLLFAVWDRCTCYHFSLDRGRIVGNEGWRC